MIVSEPLLEEFSAFVEARIGICAPRERRSELLRGIAAMTRGLDGPAVDACLRGLMQAPLTAADVGRLACHFTVGETYFFREPATFRALEYEVLPALIAARRNGNNKSLRLWSAGCCSGEEAYSLAILLHRLIPDLADWRITLLATDVNPDFLERAKRGAYRDWSFRNVPEWIRRRYFTLNDQGCYTLQREIADTVKFDYLNLMDDSFPSAASGTEAMDVILCRNVLMYFSPARARQVIAKLHAALSSTGWLAVSPTETGRDLFSAFSCMHFPEAVLYRKGSRADVRANHAPQPGLPDKTESVAPATAPEFLAVVDAAVDVAIDLAAAQERDLTIAMEVQNGNDARDMARIAKSCADRGLLVAADRWCDAAIAVDKCDARLRYLHATVLEQQGRLELAMGRLRQAVYLDRHFVLAHFALGGLCRRQGRHAEASRHLENAASLLTGYAPDDALPEAEGMTAGWLSELIHATEHLHDDTYKSQA